MKIEKDIVVSVNYQLRTKEDGEIVEQTSESEPLTFLFGHKNMLEKFEDHLKGLSVGDNFKFNLSPEDAYGKKSDEQIADIPINVFAPDGQIDEQQIYVGRQLAMSDQQGNKFHGIILEIGKETVKMDFNHPMADQHLFFSGNIVDLREATDEEKNSGQIGHTCTGCGKH